MADKTRLIVRKTIEQMKSEYEAASNVIAPTVLDAFAHRLDFNLNLASVPKVTGRKPTKAKAAPKPETQAPPQQ